MSNTTQQLKWATVRQTSQLNPFFTEPALRYLIFHSKKNGLEVCLRRIGKKILINLEQFDKWIDNNGRLLNAEREKNICLEKEKREQELQEALEQYKGETFLVMKDMDDAAILNEILARFDRLFVALPKFKNTKLDIELGAVHRKVKDFIELLIKENS